MLEEYQAAIRPTVKKRPPPAPDKADPGPLAPPFAVIVRSLKGGAGVAEGMGLDLDLDLRSDAGDLEWERKIEGAGADLSVDGEERREERERDGVTSWETLRGDFISKFSLRLVKGLLFLLLI